MTNRIVFIDSQAANYESLITDLPVNTDIVVLDANRDGVEQIVEALQGKTNLDAIDIISHGTAGTVHLGSSVLNSDSLTHYAAQFTSIGKALSKSGDILLYGCNVAAESIGQSFIKKLAHATGADIAASNDLTGAANKGGNWQLEVTTGRVEAHSLQSVRFAGLLDIIDGTSGNDTLNGTQADDEINGLLGNDILNGDAGNDILGGGAGNDTLNGDAGNDTLNGDAGNDILNGGTGNDTLNGGAGNDSYQIALGDGKDTIVDIAGTDNVQFAGISSADVSSAFRSGNDLVIMYGSGTDQLTVKSLFSSTANAVESFSFSDGIIWTNTAPTAVSLTDTLNQIDENTNTDSAIAVADIVIDDDGLLGINTITLTGTDAANFEVMGRKLFLKASTTLDYEVKSSYAVTVNVKDNTLAGSTAVTTNYTLTVNNIDENKVSAPEFVATADTLTVVSNTGINNAITSNGISFSESVLTRYFTDAQDFSMGINAMGTLTGLNATTSNSEPSDAHATGIIHVVDDVTLGGTFEISATNGFKSSSNIPVVYANKSAMTVTLNAPAKGDAILINAQARTASLNGGNGDDVLIGNVSNDTLTGNNGDDDLNGKAGNDILNGVAGNDRLTGDLGNDTLTGGAGNDVLLGGDGNDTLTGGTGNDVLSGGLGKDTLTGGTGKDIFVFDTVLSTANIDTLKDFTSGVGKIQLSQTVFSVFTVGGSVGAIDNSLASTGGSSLVYVNSSHKLYYDATAGDHADAVQIAVIGGSSVPQVADFMVI